MEIILSFGVNLLNIGVALAALMAVTSLTLHILDRFAQREFFQVPLFFMMAKLLGVVIGAVLLYVQYERRYIDIGQLFLPESPWNISVWEFLAERANPLAYGVTEPMAVVTPDGPVGWTLIAATTVALMVTIVTDLRV